MEFWKMDCLSFQNGKTHSWGRRCICTYIYVYILYVQNICIDIRQPSSQLFYIRLDKHTHMCATGTNLHCHMRALCCMHTCGKSQQNLFIISRQGEMYTHIHTHTVHTHTRRTGIELRCLRALRYTHICMHILLHLLCHFSILNPQWMI